MWVTVDKFQRRKDENSERLLEQFIASSWLLPADKDFYMLFEWYLESQYLKEEMESEAEQVISKPEQTNESANQRQWAVLCETNEEAFVLISQDTNNFIQWVVVWGKFYVAAKKHIDRDYLFDLVEQGIITAKQAKDMIVTID